MLNIGSDGIGDMYLGSDKIVKAYQGSDLVFDASGGSVTPVLPYDAEVEYLQSTGTQYINTGITIGTNTVVELKGQFTTQDSTYQTLVGSATSTDFGVMIGLQSGTGKLYIQVGKNNYALTDGSQTGLHTFIASVANSTQSLSVDGTSSSAAIVTPVSNMNMYLFARNKSTVSNFAKAKIYYCKIWNGGTLVRDFIPVRVGQVGKMYDKVSGTFFSNIGSGSFTLGNDKS